MCQNETAFHSVEESSMPFSGVSAGLESNAHEAVATTGAESAGLHADALSFFSGMSSVQLLAILGVIGLFVVVTFWGSRRRQGPN